MDKEFFRKIYRLLPGPLGKICMRFENAIIYIFYGALTTVVNYVAHFGLRIAFTDLTGVERSFTAISQAVNERSAISSAAATTIAWAVSLIFAFFVNKFFVFEAKERTIYAMGKEFLAFTGGRLFSFGCEVVIMKITVDNLGLNELAMKLAASVVVLILNYVFSKLIVFKKKKQDL